MSINEVGQAIQLIIAPVVMVTSSAILQGGLLQRYAAINDRLRGMNRERLDLLHGVGGSSSTPPTTLDYVTTERLVEMTTQVPDLLHRHRMLHRAILLVYSAILVFILSMFAIAVSIATQTMGMATAALIVFLGGTLVMMTGLVLTTLEVRVSHRSIEYETRRVQNLE